MARHCSFPVALALLWACGPRPLAGVGEGTYCVMEPDAALSGRRTFFDFPWPSDVRRAPAGDLELEGWPAPANDRVLGLKAAARGKRHFPVLPVAYFRFNGPLAPRHSLEPLPPDASAGVLLLALHPDGPRLLPTVASTLEPDAYTPEHLLAVAPLPGVVLAPGVPHAFAVLRSLGDAQGQELGIPPVLAKLMRGETVAGERGALLPGLYRKPFAALEALGVPRERLAAMTVFEPGDEVSALAQLTDAARARYAPQIEVLGLEANPRLDAAPFCHLQGRIVLPQFQEGTAFFDTQGLFGPAGDDGLPGKVRDEVALVSIALPRRPMPEGGFPLVVYFHGSGGQARELVDGADVGPDASEVSIWPATVLGQRGFAMAGLAMPLSPDRIPGASSFAYLNPSNPAAMRDTFRQGVIEARLFLDALERLRIAPAAAAGCPGLALPAGAGSYRFTFERLSVQGQSMGGMYTNLVSAVEPRIRAAVPTGAGGFWSHFALITPQIPEAEVVVGQLVGTSVSPLTFLHPALQLIQLVWEPIDPLAATPRLSRRPLPGHPARPVFEPVSERDSYFPTAIFDAMVLGYGHPLAGAEVWPGARAALASLGWETTATYPVKDNLTSENGQAYTGVAVQHANDGGFDGHGIYRRLESVKWQYGCFHQTFHQTGAAVVPPPEPQGGPCPQ